MDNKNIQIDIRLVWLLVVADIANIVYAIVQKNYSLTSFSSILFIGLSVVLWVILLSDMVKNKLFNKSFWILSMIIIPKIAQIFYLLQRNKLIRLGNKLAAEKAAEKK